MTPDDVFPLPLRGFEELFVRDDRPPTYPADFTLRFVFSGAIDPALANEALQSVTKRQPMLRCYLHESSSGRLEWAACTPQMGQPTVHSIDHQHHWQPIDLQQQRPFRIFHRLIDHQTEIIFQFHHAAFDGVGALQVVNDWMRTYQHLAADGKTNHGSKANHGKKANRLDAAALRDRCRAALPWRERLRLARWSWLSSIGFVNFFKNRPIPLVPQQAIGANGAESAKHEALSACLTESATEQLKKRATQLNATVNDLISVELAATIKTWQADQQLSPAGSHIRITIPINERSVRHRRLPACNHCTMISLDRRPSKIPLDASSVDFEKLVQGVHHEIDTVRDWRLSLSFWTILSVFRRLGGIKRWFATDEVRSTCVLTNLGQLNQRLRMPRDKSIDTDGIQMAGHFLQQVDLPAPIRFGTAAAFSLFVMNRKLNITMNFDSTSITPDQAAQLLSTLEQRLTATG